MSVRWSATQERPHTRVAPRPPADTHRGLQRSTPARRRPAVVERMSDRTIAALALFVSTGSYAIAQVLL